MECNKDEAIRAKDIADRKMQNGDFEGARKIALKARQLYPELDNISQMLAVCEVHCSAQNKLNGSDMDWYGILQIERFSDEAVIKKQYRKFALTLHPDKNKFAGAEAAFKLIGEANRVLTDPAKRSLYDMKCRGSLRPAAPKPTSHKTNWNSISKKQHDANKFSSAPQRPTFWTCCSSCNMRYQYFKELQNKTLRCQNCQNSFIAVNLYIHGVPCGSPWSQFPNQNGVPNQGPSKVAPQSNSGNPSDASFPDRFRPVDIGGSSKLNEVKSGNNMKNCGGSKPSQKANGYVNVGVQTGKGVPTKPKDLGSSKVASRKRGKQSQVESSEGFETASSDEDVVVQENYSTISGQNSGSCGGNQPRRSSRQKQNVSYKEKIIDDDDFVSSSPKRPRVSRSSSATKEEMMHNKEHLSAAAAAAVDRNKKEAKQKASSTLEESLSNRERRTEVYEMKGEEPSMVEKADAQSDNKDGMPKVDDTSNVFSNEPLFSETLEIPDPDFSNFENDKEESCFAVNQVWAIYDTTDGMPRFYARVKKVLSPGFKLQITWLEASSDVAHEKDWSDKDLPVACGKFERGGSQRTADRAMFSHQVCCINGSSRGSYLIYPKKGEIWALFKGWEMKWSSEPEKHRPPYMFEFVEVLSDFDENFGIGVAYLHKVKGFVSIFQRAAHDGVIQFCIPPTELYKFSHRIPSFRMSGKEGEGVPAGSFELDPASLPSNLDDLGDPIDTKMEKENVDSQSTNSWSQSPKGELKSTNKKICTPKKNKTGPERVSSIFGKSSIDGNVAVAGLFANNKDSRKVMNPGNLAQSGRIDISSPAKERIETPRKQDKSELAADALTPRRSPRDLSKRNSQVSANQDTEENTAANNDISNGKPSLLSKPDDKMFVKDGGSIGLILSPISPGRKVVELEVQCYNFEREKSEDKFQLDQIWALYSNEDGLPRNYGQIKVIDSTPNFRLHVAMLEVCWPPKDATRPVCCGTFKVKNGKNKVLSASKFSHLLKAQSIGNSRYEIHPRKGEIWALCKTWNSSDGESDIVEVLEDNECSVKVVVLIRAKLHESANRNKHFYWAPRIQRSITRVLDIPRGEFSRFSHQCSAFKHTGKKDRCERSYWEIDPSSIITNPVVLVD
jgi:curved DNA-binding protein CbpA